MGQRKEILQVRVHGLFSYHQLLHTLYIGITESEYCEGIGEYFLVDQGCKLMTALGINSLPYLNTGLNIHRDCR